MSDEIATHPAANPAPRRVADDVTRGMGELERMMAAGARPEERFKVRTVELPPTPNPGIPVRGGAAAGCRDEDPI